MTQPSVLLDAMHVMDRVEAEVTHDTQRREELIRLVTKTCENQHIPAPHELIAAAVDSHLNPSQAMVSAPKARFDFGWKRPGSTDTLTRRKATLHSGFHRHMRHLAEVFHYSDEGAQAGWSVVYGELLNLCLGLTVWTLFHSVPATALVSGFGAFVWPLVLGLTGALKGLGRALGQEKRLEQLKEASPRQWELEQWAKTPETRAYARQCFQSGVPYFLQGDVRRLEAIGKEVEAIRVEERRVRERLAMQAMFFMASEDTPAVNSKG